MVRCFSLLLIIALFSAHFSYGTDQLTDIPDKTVIHTTESADIDISETMTDEPASDTRDDDLPQSNSATIEPIQKNDIPTTSTNHHLAQDITDHAGTITDDPSISISNDDPTIAVPENNTDISNDSIENTHIRINEVLANPDGTDTGNEFIELYNMGDESFDISGWHLCDLSTYDHNAHTCDLAKKNTYIFPVGSIIAAKNYHTIYNKHNFSFAINNTSETIFITNAENDLLSHFSFDTSRSGISWNFAEDHWYEETPTPHATNIENPLTKDYPLIMINEVFPYPATNESENEFIELYNPNDSNISLKNWILKDASTSGKHTFNDIIIPAHGLLIIYREIFTFALNNYGEETLSLIAPNTTVISSMSYNGAQKNQSINVGSPWYWAEPTPLKTNAENPLLQDYPDLYLSEVLPNPIGDESVDEYIEIYNPNDHDVDLYGWMLSDDSSSGRYVFPKGVTIFAHAYIVIYRNTFIFALNNTNESVYLTAPNTKIVSTLSYEYTRENISYNYDLDTNNWRWSKHLTPSEPNIFNRLPIITMHEIDHDAYKNVYASFEVRAHDPDNEKLTVRWDFGNGRKSYLWKTRHKYKERGVYYASVRIQDKSEEINVHFTITVTDYPKRAVEIVAIMPNPAGKDINNEYLILKNKSTKKINLKNWSIATGSSEKTIVNHLVSHNLFIDPGKTKVIKRKHAAFSLPNKTGAIEIRRPNGTVADARSYAYGDDSIPDNALYEKIDKQWQWTIYIDPETQKKIDALITHAIFNEKSIAQQLLEREIAFEAIYAPRTQTIEKNFSIDSDRFFIMSHINLLLNKLAYHIQKYHIPHMHPDTQNTYIIQNNPSPCDPQYLPTYGYTILCASATLP